MQGSAAIIVSVVHVEARQIEPVIITLAYRYSNLDFLPFDFRNVSPGSCKHKSSDFTFLNIAFSFSWIFLVWAVAKIVVLVKVENGHKLFTELYTTDRVSKFVKIR